MHALYKGDPADAVPLYKNVACNDTRAKRYNNQKPYVLMNNL